MYDTNVWFASLVGGTTQIGPVRVCLEKERGRKKDRMGVIKDVPMSPLYIRHRSLIWNQTQRRERECFKKNLLTFRCCVAVGPVVADERSDPDSASGSWSRGKPWPHLSTKDGSEKQNLQRSHLSFLKLIPQKKAFRHIL